MQNSLQFYCTMACILLVNLLTACRACIGLFLLQLISLSAGKFPPLYLYLYTFACVTDLADGYLARALGAESGFGKVFDQVADKVLCWCVCIGLCRIHPILVPALVAMTVRDTVISLIRLHKQAPTTFASKTKTLLSMVGLWLMLTDINHAVICGILIFYLATLIGLVSILQYIR